MIFVHLSGLLDPVWHWKTPGVE